ncbi:DUF4394 domain-containing protein [Actinacidiphila oryziradicis]|uniref:DUF4394 domain-containing protein n=1 Tax=Actinacidiphila oryziradicis TaxID=2571141 RepID=UPI003899340C
MKVPQLTVALSGSRFGVNFNPVANRLRVVSDTGQNVPHTIDDKAAPLGTTVDGMLTNPTMPPSTAMGVTGAAYTNNDLNAAPRPPCSTSTPWPTASPSSHPPTPAPSPRPETSL